METLLSLAKAVSVAGIVAFFMGLAMVLLSRTRAVLSLGSLIAMGGLLACYSLVAPLGGRMAAAQYFGCLSLVMIALQLAYWIYLVRESDG